jgi:hypothetical protein
MNKKRPSKLSLHRETIHRLESSDLRAVAGASGQLGCDNTVNPSCRRTCSTAPACIETHTCETICGGGDPTTGTL